MGTTRLLLALSVALWHIPGRPLLLVQATPAVLGFFIISGFYMAMVLTEKYRDNRSFYIARLWRLYPAYFASAAALLLWLAIHHAPTAFTTGTGLPVGEQITLMWLNLFVVGQDVFELTRHTLGNTAFFNTQWMLIGQAWSLSAEVFFYCLAPFVVRSLRGTVAFLIAALALRWLLLGWLHLPWWWGYFFFPGALCMFLMGSLAYHLHAHLKLRHEKLIARVVAAGWVVALVCSVKTSGTMLPAGPRAGIDGPIFWFSYVSFAASVPLLFAWSKDSRLDRMIGDFSYPLYLVHGYVQGTLFFVFGVPATGFLGPIAALCASVIAAIAVRVLVELPIEAWRPGRLPRSSTGAVGRAV
jgi:peptidoglycan/LPS O-acetylase OafA/YrhL